MRCCPSDFLCEVGNVIAKLGVSSATPTPLSNGNIGRADLAWWHFSANVSIWQC